MVQPPTMVCPFCGEGSAEPRCAVHDLTLIPRAQFETATAITTPDDSDADDDVPSDSRTRWSLALIIGGALAMIVGFLVPFVSGAHGDVRASALELASTRSPSLWNVLFVAIALMYIVSTRRTGAALRRAWLAVLVVAWLPALSVAHTLLRVHKGAEQMSERLGIGVDVHVLAGPWLIAAGVLLVSVAALLCGYTRR